MPLVGLAIGVAPVVLRRERVAQRDLFTRLTVVALAVAVALSLPIGFLVSAGRAVWLLLISSIFVVLLALLSFSISTALIVGAGADDARMSKHMRPNLSLNPDAPPAGARSNFLARPRFRRAG
jgi:fatty acid desaturase